MQQVRTSSSLGLTESHWVSQSRVKHPLLRAAEKDLHELRAALLIQSAVTTWLIHHSRRSEGRSASTAVSRRERAENHVQMSKFNDARNSLRQRLRQPIHLLVDDQDCLLFWLLRSLRSRRLDQLRLVERTIEHLQGRVAAVIILLCTWLWLALGVYVTFGLGSLPSSITDASDAAATVEWCGRRGMDWWALASFVISVPYISLVALTLNTSLARATFARTDTVLNVFNGLRFLLCYTQTLDSSCWSWKAIFVPAQLGMICIWSMGDALVIPVLLRAYIGVFLIAMDGMLLYGVLSMRGHTAVVIYANPGLDNTTLAEYGLESEYGLHLLEHEMSALIMLIIMFGKDVTLCLLQPQLCRSVQLQVQKMRVSTKRSALVTESVAQRFSHGSAQRFTPGALVSLHKLPRAPGEPDAFPCAPASANDASSSRADSGAADRV